MASPENVMPPPSRHTQREDQHSNERKKIFLYNLRYCMITPNCSENKQIQESFIRKVWTQNIHVGCVFTHYWLEKFECFWKEKFCFLLVFQKLIEILINRSTIMTFAYWHHWCHLAGKGPTIFWFFDATDATGAIDAIHATWCHAGISGATMKEQFDC